MEPVCPDLAPRWEGCDETMIGGANCSGTARNAARWARAAVTLPPCRSTSPLTMPEPLRLVLASAWENRLNKAGIMTPAMPFPSSDTDTMACSPVTVTVPLRTLLSTTRSASAFTVKQDAPDGRH